MTPFFSIVVVCYNAEKNIADTINSVLNQEFVYYEIIVKDGLSTDDTLINIPSSDKIRVYSRKDSGIYDAMNQAIELSAGKYLCFLNCGDVFANSDVLHNIYETVCNYDETIVYGDYSRKGVIFKQASSLTDFYLYRNHLCHQTMFISKKVFDIYGLYDTNYSIAADYEHTLRCYFSGVNLLKCGKVICDYLGDGVSETSNGYELTRKERKEIIHKYYSKIKMFKYELFLAISLKKIRQKFISDASPEFLRIFYRKIVNLINR